MTARPYSPAVSLPPDRRGRLRNGATPGDFLAAPRCGAQTRSGECCRQPAMKNGRCRMHGGLSTGPRTAEGRARCAAARRTHGFYSAEMVALRRAGTAYCRRMDALFASLKIRRTAGHGLLPPEIRSQKSEARTGQGRAQPLRSAGPRAYQSSNALPASGFCVLASDPTAGQGVLPPVSTRPPDSARPLRQPAPRQGFIQRTLLGSTALGLGLGLTVPPPVPAGHGLLPSFPRRAG